MVRAKSPFGCSSSRRLRYCLTSRRYANLSSFPFPSTGAANEYSSRACPSRSRPILASAMSSSSIGAWPHHSDSRCPRIKASSARRSVYSTSGVSETVMDATAMFLLVLFRPHPEERALARVPKDGPESVPYLHPSRRLQSLASGRALRGPGGKLLRMRTVLLARLRKESASHMPDFVRHVVKRRVTINLR